MKFTSHLSLFTLLFAVSILGRATPPADHHALASPHQARAIPDDLDPKANSPALIQSEARVPEVLAERDLNSRGDGGVAAGAQDSEAEVFPPRKVPVDQTGRCLTSSFCNDGKGFVWPKGEPKPLIKCPHCDTKISWSKNPRPHPKTENIL